MAKSMSVKIGRNQYLQTPSSPRDTSCSSANINATAFMTRCSTPRVWLAGSAPAAGNHRIAGRGATAALPARRRTPAAADGHHLQRVWRFGGRRTHFPLRPDSAHRARPTNGTWIERGLKQRIHALNEFIDDIYHDQKILKDKIIPEEVIQSATFYRPQCLGINPPRRVWCHITGTDLVRHGDGQIYVLEDNLRVPSGVSYVLENRDLMKRTFPQVFEGLRVRPVDDYPSKLLEMLESMRRRGRIGESHRGAADARACTTRPTSNTVFWRSRWAFNWSKGAIWWCRTARSGCAPPKACARWT